MQAVHHVLLMPAAAQASVFNEYSSILGKKATAAAADGIDIHITLGLKINTGQPDRLFMHTHGAASPLNVTSPVDSTIAHASLCTVQKLIKRTANKTIQLYINEK